MFEPRDRLFVDAVGEERHVVGPFFEHLLEHGFQEIFGQVRVGGQIGERDLRLDHPELGEVTAGVRIFRAERRPERVHLRQRETVAFDVQLTRHGEIRLLAEEVLLEVDAVAGPRRVQRVERADAKQLAGAFAVARGDDRRVDPDEAVAVEVAVHRLRDRVAHTGDGAKRIRARAQVRDRAQIFERVTLLRDRIRFGIVDRADQRDARRLNLAVLILALRFDDACLRLRPRSRSSV